MKALPVRLVRRGCGIVSATVLLSACGDDPTPVGPVSRPGPGNVPLGTVMPVDQAINSNDTWVSFDAYRDQSSSVYSDQPIYDARTDQYTSTMTAATAVQPLHAEAGYDYNGTLRYNEYRQVPADDPTDTPVDPTSRIQVVGSDVTVYDETGAPTQAAEVDATEPALAELGPLDGAQVTTGVVLDHDPVNGTAVYSMSPSGSSGPRVRAIRIGNDRARLESVTTERTPVALRNEAVSHATHKNKVARTYKKNGDRWVLEEIEVVDEIQTDKGKVENRQTMRLRNVRWHENKGKDDERKVRREKIAAGLIAPRTEPSSNLNPPGDHCIIDEYGNPCQPEDPPPPPDGGGTPTGPDYCAGGDPGGRNVVFQHGIFSQRDTWGDLPERVNQDVRLGCRFRPNLDSNERLAQQAGALADSIQQYGRGSLLLIGHSQGGLISRYVAQHNSSLVNGVVTLGSPHRGAPIVNTSRPVVAAVLGIPGAVVYNGCSSPRGLRCTAGSFLIGSAVGLAKYGADAAVPAFIDLKPGSAFQQQLNNTYEPFPRAGIQSHASRIFVEWRIGFDASSSSPDNGRKGVKAAYVTVGATTACAVVGWFIGRGGTAARCAAATAGIVAFDLIWNGMVSGFGKTDGIVPGSSQVYPNALRNLPMRDGAPSHTGETKSRETRQALRVILPEVMGVTPR